ncbi:MAG: transcriptional activator RfaH [Hyphomicrobium sp.]|jgi:transcriptional antiterminator RfaH
MKRWYVVASQPLKEARAESNLCRQGYEVWLPKLLRERRHARRIDRAMVPMFPGYLFVRFDPDVQPWRAINGTFGVRHLIVQGDRPRPILGDFVDRLKEAADESGIVGLQGAEALRSGHRLRLLTGPFADTVGTLVRLAQRDRVAMLLDLLGREVEILVSRRDVMAVA